MNMKEQESFDFCCPTRIIYRPEGLSLIGKIIREDYHFSKVFLVYGGKSLKETGRYALIAQSLKDNHVDFQEYRGISINPDIEDVIQMTKLARCYKPDLILAAGGGSVLDAAKSLAHACYYDGNPLDFNKKNAIPLHALPIGTIITLCASGSEMSDSCVISDRKHNFKAGFNAPTNYPLFSLMDPSLTYTVSPYQTAVGLADMFSHSMERYYSPSHEFEPADDLALSIMKNIVDVSLPVLKNPNGYEERRSMMICGALSHDGFTSFGKRRIFRVHVAEHKLSGAYPQLVHGQGIALLLVPYLEKNILLFKDKIIKMGEAVFHIHGSTDPKDGIQALKAWIESLPLAHSFEELGYSINEDILKKADALLEAKQQNI